MVGESNILEALELGDPGNSLKVRNEVCIRQHEPVNIYVRCEHYRVIDYQQVLAISPPTTP
jgi:recombinational DNA repair ATPase RecF